MGDVPSVSRLAGQLGYLFEERPELREASVTELTAWLNREDRMARARAQDPVGRDEKVVAAAAQLEDRITEAGVSAALRQVRHDRR